MSFQERRSIVNLVSALLITACYAAYMVLRFPGGNGYSQDIFSFWGAFFLILIPVRIVASIIIYFVFYAINTIVTKEEEPSMTDERDRFIALKATRFSLYTFGCGFLLAMGSLVVHMPPSTMFIILMCSGLVAEIVSESVQFSLYRNGV